MIDRKYGLFPGDYLDLSYEGFNPQILGIGSTAIESLVISPNRDCVDLQLENGRIIRLVVRADCCSRSYLGDYQVLQELLGAKIVAMEQREAGPPTEHETADEDGFSSKHTTKYNVLTITTDRGYVDLDFRNDSNGWYNGYICLQVLDGDKVLNTSSSTKEGWSWNTYR